MIQLYSKYQPGGGFINSIRMISLLFLLLIVTIGCQDTNKPEPLHAEDVCENCRMAVSDIRFAAQAILKNGTRVKFDDVGCLVAFAEKPDVKHIWVGSYDQKDWVRADFAAYVNSDDITTPMNSGIVAFSSKSTAHQYLYDNKGSLMTWDEMVGKSSKK